MYTQVKLLNVKRGDLCAMSVLLDTSFFKCAIISNPSMQITTGQLRSIYYVADIIWSTSNLFLVFRGRPKAACSVAQTQPWSGQKILLQQQGQRRSLKCSLIIVRITLSRYDQFHNLSILLFWYNIIDLPGVKIPDPLLGRILCLLIPSVDSLFSVADSLKGFLSWHDVLQGPSTPLVRCIRNYRDIRTPSGVPS